MTGPPRTTVLGSGIAATACALFAARSGSVVLAGTPPAGRATAVESLPAAGLTLLLELGVVPRELGVDRLVRGRTMTWEHAAPVHHDGPACAHLDRGALLRALWRRVTADARITVMPRGGARSARGGRLVDATGTRAASAVAVVRRPDAWTAATVTLPRSGADPGLRLAAAPDGYGYRLGSADLLTVGWVGSGRPPRDGPALWRCLADRAAWLLDGLPGPPCGPTYRRPAGLALPVAADHAVPIGDAALTRDALASQGVSIALSDACLAADPRIGDAALTARRADARERHVRHLAEALRTCRHADQQAWASYRHWLEQLPARSRPQLASPSDNTEEDPVNHHGHTDDPHDGRLAPEHARQLDRLLSDPRLEGHPEALRAKERIMDYRRDETVPNRHRIGAELVRIADDIRHTADAVDGADDLAGLAEDLAVLLA
jgi:hypothetical protein